MAPQRPSSSAGSLGGPGRSWSGGHVHSPVLSVATPVVLFAVIEAVENESLSKTTYTASIDANSRHFRQMSPEVVDPHRSHSPRSLDSPLSYASDANSASSS